MKCSVQLKRQREGGRERKTEGEIQHDFAINESEKGLEMIFDLIE